jgi:diadenosine tetraphosphatase ApaH/serine/threonine PP2A family protein phosphatase
MRIAIISDVHANLEALSAVLERSKVADVDETWCLGDLVGYGPSPNECIEIIREKCAVVLKGNHDAGATGEEPLKHFNLDGQEAMQWTLRELSQENTDYLRSLPLTAERGDATLAHASTADPQRWTYILTWRDAQDAFGYFATSMCFIGHTHVPLIIGEDRSMGNFRNDVRLLINVGSVGQPRDGNPMASFGLFDTQLWKYENIRVEYDVQKTVEKIEKVGLPRGLGVRLLAGV